MPLYEVAVLEKPTKKEAEEGAQEKLILAPKPVVAKDEQAAVLAVAVGEEMKGINLDRIEIKIRPF